MSQFNTPAAVESRGTSVERPFYFSSSAAHSKSNICLTLYLVPPEPRTAEDTPQFPIQNPSSPILKFL